MVFKVGSLAQQHQRHLGTYWKCSFSDLTTDSQQLGRRGMGVGSDQHSSTPLGDSHAHSNWRITEKQHRLWEAFKKRLNSWAVLRASLGCGLISPAVDGKLHEVRDSEHPVHNYEGLAQSPC